MVSLRKQIRGPSLLGPLGARFQIKTRGVSREAE